MAEQIGKLRETLTELRSELSDVDQIDDDTRHLLEATLEQLHDALHQEDGTALKHPTLQENLTKVTEEFEESHPTLTKIIGNMVDILGNSGL